MSEKDRFLTHIEQITETGCWIWMSCIRKTGYGAFGFRRKVEYAHRASYLIFRGDIPSGMYVCHKCDIRACVNPSHLFLGTQKQNMQDASAKGRVVMPRASYASDDSHQVAKLTNEQVEFIRGSSERPYSLAKKYGVTYRTIWNAKTRRTFRDV